MFRLRSDDYASACTSFTNALMFNPADARLLLNRAACYYNMDNSSLCQKVKIKAKMHLPSLLYFYYILIVLLKVAKIIQKNVCQLKTLLVV
jgi:hypothetical protein